MSDMAKENTYSTSMSTRQSGPVLTVVFSYEVLTMNLSPKSLFEQTMLSLKRSYDDEIIMQLHTVSNIPKFIINRVLNTVPGY